MVHGGFNLFGTGCICAYISCSFFKRKAIKPVTLPEFWMHVEFEQVFPQVACVSLASFAFHITAIAVSIVCPV